MSRLKEYHCRGCRSGCSSCTYENEFDEYMSQEDRDSEMDREERRIIETIRTAGKIIREKYDEGEIRSSSKGLYSPRTFERRVTRPKGRTVYSLAGTSQETLARFMTSIESGSREYDATSPTSANKRPSVLDKKVTYLGTENDTNCAICLKDFAKDEQVIKLTSGPVPHIFHPSCIRGWYASGGSIIAEPGQMGVVCPTCRTVHTSQFGKKRRAKLLAIESRRSKTKSRIRRHRA